GTRSNTTIPSLISKRLQDQDRSQHGAEDYILAIQATTILIAAVVTIFVAATEALAKVIVVVVTLYVIATVTVIGVAIGVIVFKVVTPVILPVCLSRAE